MTRMNLLFKGSSKVPFAPFSPSYFLYTHSFTQSKNIWVLILGQRRCSHTISFCSLAGSVVSVHVFLLCRLGKQRPGGVHLSQTTQLGRVAPRCGGVFQNVFVYQFWFLQLYIYMMRIRFLIKNLWRFLMESL